jgi:hypothetical protein
MAEPSLPLSLLSANSTSNCRTLRPWGSEMYAKDWRGRYGLNKTAARCERPTKQLAHSPRTSCSQGHVLNFRLSFSQKGGMALLTPLYQFHAQVFNKKLISIANIKYFLYIIFPTGPHVYKRDRYWLNNSPRPATVPHMWPLLHRLFHSYDSTRARCCSPEV